MRLKPIFWFLLKKLPMILAVLVAPATLMLVLHYNPGILRFFDPSSGPKPPEYVEPPPEEPPPNLRMENEPSFEETEEQVPPAEPGRAAETGEVAKTVDPAAADWEAEAQGAAGAEDFFALAVRARAGGEEDLARWFYLEALKRDPAHAGAHEGLGEIRFDPAFHLTEFDRFEGHQLEAMLGPFREREGEWLGGAQVAELRERWRAARQKMEAELARREADPLDAARRRHLRLLMRRDFYSRIIGKGEFFTDRRHPPFLFFLEGIEVEDRVELKPFIDTAAADLGAALRCFKDTYRPGGSEDLEGDGEEPYFIWVLRTEGGFKAFYDRTDRMLVLHRPAGKAVYPGSEPLRRRTALFFGRMLLDRFANHGAGPALEAWLAEGVPNLLAMGKGFQPHGILRLNGDGSAVVPAFTDWVALDRGAWPIPLETLLGFEDRDALFRACAGPPGAERSFQEQAAPEKVFEGAAAACALFCRDLLEGPGREAFLDYASARLSGKADRGGVKALLGGRYCEDIERALTERFAGSPERIAGMEEGGAFEPSAGEEDGEFGSRDVLSLIRPGIPQKDFRAVLIHLVGKAWCYTACAMIDRRLAETGMAREGSGLEEDLALLEEAAGFEADLFRNLAEGDASFTLEGEEMRLEDAREGRMVLRPAQGGEKIRTAWSNLGLRKFITLCKREIGEGKSEQFRLGYSLFYLLRNDGAALRREMNFIKYAKAEEERLKSRLALYESAEDGVRLLDFLSMEWEVDLEKLKSLLLPLRGTFLSDALAPGLRRCLRARLLRKYAASPEDCLASAFKGFRSIDPRTGRALFVYPFENPEEIQDFDLEEHPFFQELLGAEGALPGWKRFSIRDGSLACYGSNGAVLIPLFTGALRLSLTFRIADAEDETVSMDAYFGFGLGSEQGVIASAFLTDLWIQQSSAGRSWYEKGRARSLDLGRSYTILLEGDPDHVIGSFDDSERVILTEPGLRTGRVFLFVSMPVSFMIEHLEVEARLEPAWLKESVSARVKEKVEKIFN